MSIVGVAPGTTTFDAWGFSILAPVLEVYGPTGDYRRWPDNMFAEVTESALNYAGITDKDLRQLVYNVSADGVCRGVRLHSLIMSQEDFTIFINVMDAAIDEQDRRYGRPVRPVQRER